MAILMMEGFRGYPVVDDMISDSGRRGPWTTFAGSTSLTGSLVDNPTWRGDGSTIKAYKTYGNNDRNAIQREFTSTPVKSVCAQFICGTSGSAITNAETCNFVLFQDLVTDPVTAGSGLSSFYGISIRATSVAPGTPNSVGVYYTILTAATGNVNQALIGYLKPWTKDRHYHVELKVDHTNPLARIVVYVNGVLELDATYDRDRIDSGFQTTEFKRVLLGSTANTAFNPNRQTHYSNLVIYTDEPGTVFPMGPIDLETVSPTAGQGYDGLRVSDDTTYATIPPGGTLNGTFDDLGANPNPVLAVDATVRHGSVGGLEPSQITTQIKKADGTVLGSTMTTAAPGTPPTHRRIRLNAATAADVNGATFTITAAG